MYHFIGDNEIESKIGFAGCSFVHVGKNKQIS